ncbi:MAG: ABC transporter ATP-binding protein [Bacteroidales bacterium]|nr:ABC transporter ATP-binding protein [Bacteroidales bacterium]
MAIAIEFNNVSKQYRLGLVSTKTLSHDIHRWWTVNIRGKEDPYLKIGSVNDRSSKADSEYVWALKDIDFKVEQGDVVGIIGKNGAGKSTLLKILSKVTGPTTGSIRARGRIGSLLEVGTGFHPEMTGRENIFLNGAILGMTKAEINRKLDEIIDFSGCERYIDTPVKRYSSGMTVRLGFAVAAFLEPEILVVDEVLAVGDAEFQRKAIGKMQDVSKGEGRTVLFVSHNMASIQQLCHHGILLKNGMVEKTGNVREVVDYYLGSMQTVNDFNREGNGAVRIIDFRIQNSSISLGENLEIEVDIEAKQNVTTIDASFDIKDESGKQVAHVASNDDEFQIGAMRSGEKKTIHCVIKNVNLAPGGYTSSIWIGTPYVEYDMVINCVRFSVTQNDTFIKRGTPYDKYSKVVLPSNWKQL